jgi:hypothetical protein
VACGGGHLELVERRDGVAWLLPRLVGLIERWSPTGLAYDHGGPGQATADQLVATSEQVRELLMPLGGREMASASAQLFDRVQAALVSVTPSGDLTASVGAARRRLFGQSWIFARDTEPVSGVPLLAAVLALWACDHAAAPAAWFVY